MTGAVDHDWYADLAEKNYAALPGFQRRQVEAGQEISETLLPHIQKGAVKVIVDLGCGSGEVLLELARRLNERQGNLGGTECLILVGLDRSPTLIRKALENLVRANLSERVRCRFAVVEDPTSLPNELFERILQEERTSVAETSDRMAVLCLGHTIFHLPYLEHLYASLKEGGPSRPLMFIVDVYHSWDSVIEELRTSGASVVTEPRSFALNEQGARVLNVLFTRRIETGGRLEVERGLYQTEDITAPGDQRIVTRQIAQTSKEMCAEFDRGGYFVAQQTASHSGYGEMTRFTFLRTLRSFPLPAMFLDTKAVPPLVSGQGTEAVAQGSPLQIVAQWMEDSGFIEPIVDIPGNSGDGGFDFAFVEMSPWYSSDQGLRALRLELLICAKAAQGPATQKRDHNIAGGLLHGASAEDLKRGLAAYRDVLSRFQSLNIGPFLHPRFAGYDGVNEWARPNFSLISSRSPVEEFSGEDKGRYERWRSALDGVEVAPSDSTNNFSVAPASSGKVRALIESTSIEQFLTSLPDGVQNYGRRLIVDHLPEANDAKTFHDIGPDILARDLDMVHALLHERLRLALGLQSEDGVSSVLLGIPLRILPDKGKDEGQHLPDRHKGGVWLLAGKTGGFGPRQNVLIGDLARLSVLLANSAVDARAADAILKNRRNAHRQVESVGFNRASWVWANATTVISNSQWFQAGGEGLHSFSGWMRLCKDGIPQHLEAFADNMMKFANNLNFECIGRNIEISFEECVAQLKELSRRPNAIYAPIIGNLLSHGAVPTRFDESNLVRRSVVCSPDVGGGRFLRALNQFCCVPLQDAEWTHICRSVEFEDEPQLCHITFIARYKDRGHAEQAISELQTPPSERIRVLDRQEGAGSGEGNEAFNWLTQASMVREHEVHAGSWIQSLEQREITFDENGLVTIRFTYPWKVSYD